MKRTTAILIVAFLWPNFNTLAQVPEALAQPEIAADPDDVSDSIDPSEVAELFSEDDILKLDEFDVVMDQWLDTQLWFMIESASRSGVTIHVDKRRQRMTVVEGGVVKFKDWKVSTGKGRGETRSGKFKPFEMNKNYFSRKFKVILPYGIKFDGGNLIHAASTGGVHYLGQKRSHGCVRLHPTNAKILFEMVKRAGMGNTRVIVENAPYQGHGTQTASLPDTDI